MKMLLWAVSDIIRDAMPLSVVVYGSMWDGFFQIPFLKKKNAHKINRGVMCGSIAWIVPLNDLIPIRIDISMAFARTLIQAEPSKLFISMHISVSFYWNQTM